MPSLAQLQVKHPHFKTVIHRKLNLRETWHFCNIVTKGNTLIWIAVHADLHGQENLHGSYIIEEIADHFDFIVIPTNKSRNSLNKMDPYLKQNLIMK